jgi:methylthioribulose-1-phosphate dehydratase
MVTSNFAAPALSFEIEALCETARWCYDQGWAPATSGNFSLRDSAAGRMIISPSGIDKGRMFPEDLLAMDLASGAVIGAGTPSAEAGLHRVIYRDRPQAEAVLHVHTVWNTLLSGRFASEGYVSIEGYEILKGLSGVNTHAHLEQVPVIENMQNYDGLARELSATLRRHPNAHGILLSRHGLYTWGQSVAEARRHLEVFEFLFEVVGRRMMSS